MNLLHSKKSRVRARSQITSQSSPLLGLLVAMFLVSDEVVAMLSGKYCPQASLHRPVGSCLNANVISSLSLNPEESPTNTQNDINKKKKRKLSRPERKARERANKQAAKRKHNFADRKDILNARPAPGRYDLHSNLIASLSPENSTADDVMRAIKRAQNLHDIHDLRAIERFLVEKTDPSFAYGYRGSLLSRLAVAAMHMGNYRLAERSMRERRDHHRESFLPMESAALIRGLLRLHNVTEALSLLEDELPLPAEDELKPESKNVLVYRARALGSVASRHFFENEPSLAVLACRKLAQVGPLVRLVGLAPEDLQLPWARILKGAAQCEARRRNGEIKLSGEVEVERMPCNVVYAVLSAMATFPCENTDRVYEIVASALVRRVVFVTGAVDMNGCPAADRGEAAFIGRSNVGKSSLVNMVTNRKSLAYTSKRPGKTQQFNFFAVNDKPGLEKQIKYGDNVEGSADQDTFYIVDLPGFGFAKVPQIQRNKWSNMMFEYMTERRTLRVLFHLIDGRHGPVNEDMTIMRQVGEVLPPSAKYVVVLTKADKNVKNASTKNSGRVTTEVMNNLRDAMKSSGVGNAPVILSSSQTKLGRDDVWRYLRLAAEG